MEDHGIPNEEKVSYVTFDSKDMWQINLLNKNLSEICVPAIIEVETPFLDKEFWSFHADEPRSVIWLTGIAILKFFSWVVFNVVMLGSLVSGFLLLIGWVFSLGEASIDSTKTFIWFIEASCPFVLTMLWLSFGAGSRKGIPHCFSKTKVRTTLR